MKPKQFYGKANRAGDRLSDADAARCAEHLRYLVRRAMRDGEG
ncbi:MAG: hypothetical protein AAGJ38_02640 [Planctomycetota bacterium]